MYWQGLGLGGEEETRFLLRSDVLPPPPPLACPHKPPRRSFRAFSDFAAPVGGGAGPGSGLEPGSGKGRAAGLDPLGLSPLLNQLGAVLASVEGIEKRLGDEAEAAAICKEWEQLSRVCERLLMIIFVFITVLFAVLMLHSHGQNTALHHGY